MVSKTDLCGSLHLIGIHVQMWRGYVYATLFSFFGKQPRDNADHWPQADLFEYFSKGFNPTSRSEEYHTKDQVRVKHLENLWNSCSRPTSCCTERWWVLLNYSAVMCPQTCTYLRGFSTLCLSRLTILSSLWPLVFGQPKVFLPLARRSCFFSTTQAERRTWCLSHSLLITSLRILKNTKNEFQSNPK